MAGNLGFAQRSTRELMIVNGSKLTDSSKQTLSLPNADGVVYFSGEPVWVSPATIGDAYKIDADGPNYKDSDNKWTTTFASGKPVYFAFTDSDEYQGSGLNMAISSVDDFEIQTPFFDQSVVYTPGDLLTVKAVSFSSALPEGNCPASAVGLASGSANLVTKAVSGDYIVGVVTKGVISVNGSNFNGPAAVRNIADNASTDEDESQKLTGGPAIWTENSKTNTVLQFATKFSGAKV